MKTIVICAAVVAAAAALAAAQPGQTGNTDENSGNDQGSMSSMGNAGGSMSDARVAALVKTINDSEIKESKLAERHAKSSKVKQFARRMVRDHTQNNQEIASVARRIGLQPAPDQQANALKQQAQEAAQTLESSSGAGFDRSYVDQMVKDHQNALTQLDTLLSNDVGRNEQLDALIKKTRQAVQHHLDMAQKLQGQLGAAPSEGAEPSPKGD